MSEEQDLAQAIEEATPEATLDEQVPNVHELFMYSRYVHVGAGADGCPGGEDGSCRDDAHFHAWVRLPNAFQWETIAAKARAARARAQRSLRDPASDLCVIMEADIEELVAEGTAKETLVELLTGVENFRLRADAMQWVEESDEEKWGTRTEDVYRRRELEEMDPDLRSEDELGELVRRAEEYADAVEDRMRQLKDPHRQALMELSEEELVEQYRTHRIKVDADNAFSSAYNRYQWFICTLKPVAKGRPNVRCFNDMPAFEVAAPEIHAALNVAFTELEVALRASPAGNS